MARRLHVRAITYSLLILASACGGSSRTSVPISDRCASAFSTAASVDEMHDTLADLFPAYSACSSFEEWKAADARYPKAIGGADPVLYARNVCAANTQLTSTPICRAVAVSEQGIPLTFEQIRRSDPGAVTVDLLDHPSSVQAKYVDAVMKDAGLYSPLGFNDKTLIVYGLDTCANPAAALPVDWSPAPGDTQADVNRFAAAARLHASTTLCS
jgi:hypothetical protein